MEFLGLERAAGKKIIMSIQERSGHERSNSGLQHRKQGFLWEMIIVHGFEEVAFWTMSVNTSICLKIQPNIFKKINNIRRICLSLRCCPSKCIFLILHHCCPVLDLLLWEDRKEHAFICLKFLCQPSLFFSHLLSSEEGTSGRVRQI